MLFTAALAFASLVVDAPVDAAAAPPHFLTGYLQTDFVHDRASEDELAAPDAAGQTGQPLNADRFLVRRGRLLAEAIGERADVALELDVNTVDGLRVGARRAEAGLRWQPPTASQQAPLLRLGAGLFRAPFSHEIAELSDRDRLFAERAAYVDAFFPGQSDVGAQLSAQWPTWTATFAVMNGEPQGERAFPARDPDAAKDLLARLSGGGAVASAVRVDAGASVVWGRGFHAGTAATKPSLEWRDLNGDGIVQPAELVGLPGAAATASSGFDRWAAEGDLRVTASVPRIGALTVFGEVALGVNMDRGLRPSDPTRLGRDARAFGAYAGFVQEIGRFASAGVRWDVYEPALDATTVAGGAIARARERFRTWAFALAARIPGRTPARVLLQYEVRRDPLAIDAVGRPTDLANDRFTGRLQVAF